MAEGPTLGDNRRDSSAASAPEDMLAPSIPKRDFVILGGQGSVRAAADIGSPVRRGGSPPGIVHGHLEDDTAEAGDGSTHFCREIVLA
jgi:hypothetical protein